MSRASTATSPTALLVDFGGVLTSPIADSLAAWAQGDDLEPAEVARAVGALRDEAKALETGQLAGPEYERALATVLRTRSGAAVPAEGLLARMFAGFAEDAAMTGVLLRARAAGIRTGLLSNSWGNDYPRETWDALFDVTVISGEVGLRKPQPEIYLLAAERLGVPPGEVVFVDDLEPNVRGAARVGMVGVHHRDAATTAAELEALLGVALG